MAARMSTEKAIADPVSAGTRRLTWRILARYPRAGGAISFRCLGGRGTQCRPIGRRHPGCAGDSPGRTSAVWSMPTRVPGRAGGHGGEKRIGNPFPGRHQATVGPNSSVVLDSFLYDPAAPSGTLVIGAAEGVFRFVSGNMPSESYEIRTPEVTVGVRGTVIDFVARGGATAVVLQSRGSRRSSRRKPARR